jgi:hypothetical protein
MSILVLVPQTARALGFQLFVSGVLYAVGLLVIVGVALRERSRSRQPLSWHITRVVVALAAGVPAVVAGASLWAEAGGGLYWLVPSIVFSLAAGSGNAWVLLIEVVRDERYQP